MASYFSGEALFVCVPGVKSIGCLGETLSSLGIRKVFGAYDMDMYQNPEVLKDMVRMRKLVLDIGIAYEPYHGIRASRAWMTTCSRGTTT